MSVGQRRDPGAGVRGAEGDQCAYAQVTAHALHVVPGDQAAQAVPHDVHPVAAGALADLLHMPAEQLGGGADVVDLSGKEAALLEVLARRPTKVFTRPELLSAVFDPEDGQGTVDTYVYYLRRKLGRDVIRTVHGLGYRLGVG